MENLGDVVADVRGGAANPAGPAAEGAPIPVAARKRGRPAGRKAAAPVDPEQAQMTALCANAFGKLASLPYDLMARKHPEIWTLKDEEREELGNATVRLLDRYMPAWLEKNPEIAAFIIVNVVIILPRFPAYLKAVAADRNKAKELLKELKDKPEPVKDSAEAIKENAHGDSRAQGDGKNNAGPDPVTK